MASMNGPRRALERQIETVTIGLLVVWIGVAMATTFDNDTAGLDLMVAGGILLAGAILQRVIGGQAGAMVIAGLVVGLLGLDDFLASREQELPIAAIVVIVVGTVIFLSAFSRRGRGPRISVTSSRDDRA